MTEFYKTIMGRKFFDADVPRAVAALEHIATALSVLVPAMTTPPAGDGPAPRTSTGGPVSVTVRGVRITVEMPPAPVPDLVDLDEPEQRCFTETYRGECEGTGHPLCDKCANKQAAPMGPEQIGANHE